MIALEQVEIVNFLQEFRQYYNEKFPTLNQTERWYSTSTTYQMIRQNEDEPAPTNGHIRPISDVHIYLIIR